MQTALIIIGVIIGAFLFLIFMSKAKMKNIPTVADSQNILTLTAQNFQNQIKDKLILVDFWAPWCAPCRMMGPILNDISGELTGNSKVGKVNVDEHQALAQKYKVRGIPTMILFKNGTEISRFVGVKSKDFLINAMGKAQ
jgi:thioredoxin 1